MADPNSKNVLSADVEIKGSIKFTNDLIIDGKVEGEIISSGVLTIGQNAEIRGEIKTKSVTVLGKVHATRRTPYIAIVFTTLLSFALISFVGEVPALGGTTALLLLCVFTVVNVAVLVLRKDTVDHKHFRAPTFVPVLGAVCCGFLTGPWTGRDPQQYVIAAVLIAIGVALWFVTMAVNRAAADGTTGGRNRRWRCAQLIARGAQPVPEQPKLLRIVHVSSRARACSGGNASRSPSGRDR